MRSEATTPGGYVKALPAERRSVIRAVRALIRRHLPRGYRESVNWGMLAYEIPLRRYPNTYNDQPLCCIALAAQKQYCALYLNCIVADSARHRELLQAFARAGKRLNMGKSCIRFKSLDDLPLADIGRFVAAIPPEAFIRQYEQAHKSA